MDYNALVKKLKEYKNISKKMKEKNAMTEKLLIEREEKLLEAELNIAKYQSGWYSFFFPFDLSDLSLD